MEEEPLDEELHMMFDEQTVKVLDSSTFKKPISSLNVGQPVCLEPEQKVQDALLMMQVKHFGCLLVVKDGILAGILTERDIIAKALSGEGDLSEMTVEEIMTPNPEAFQPDDSLAYVMNSMHVGGYRHVPIVNEQCQPLAVVSVKDIIGFIVEHFSEEVLNLPPRPVRKTEAREGA